MLGVKVESKLDTVIGPETEVKGDVSARGSMRLDGRIEGAVSVMDTLHTGKDSYIRGNVNCSDASIAGKVEGNVTARGVVEIHTGGTVIGDVACRSLVLEKDAYLDGRVKMGEGDEGR